MKNQPLVSIVTMTYKNFKGFQKTMDSVLRQDYPRMEYIIADDCSPDFNEEKVREYIMAHKGANVENVIIIHGEENVGTVRNLNRAYQRASGEIVMPLSCGDFFWQDDVVSRIMYRFETVDTNAIITRRVAVDASVKKAYYIPGTRDASRLMKLEIDASGCCGDAHNKEQDEDCATGCCGDAHNKGQDEACATSCCGDNEPCCCGRHDEQSKTTGCCCGQRRKKTCCNVPLNIRQYRMYITNRLYDAASGSVLALRRARLEEMGWFDENYRLLEDSPFFLNFLWEEPVHCALDIVSIGYALTGVSGKSKHPLLVEDDIRVIKVEKQKHTDALCFAKKDWVMSEYERTMASSMAGKLKACAVHPVGFTLYAGGEVMRRLRERIIAGK